MANASDLVLLIVLDVAHFLMDFLDSAMHFIEFLVAWATVAATATAITMTAPSIPAVGASSEVLFLLLLFTLLISGGVSTSPSSGSWGSDFFFLLPRVHLGGRCLPIVGPVVIEGSALLQAHWADLAKEGSDD